MSYILNKTDGSILTELVDGVLDNDTADISLVGRNYTGWGEFINENFIKILENFANSNPPVTPLKGQIWFDSSDNKLKVYDGVEFVPAAGSFVATEQPQDPTAGDTWFKSDTDQLYLYDGQSFKLIGPQFTAQQGESGAVVRTVQDQNLNSRTVLEIIVGGALQAVVSNAEFTPSNTPGNFYQQLVTPSNPAGTIRVGYNIVNVDNFIWRGSALRARSLVKPDGTEVLASKIVGSDDPTVNLSGNLVVSNAAGITIGPSQNTRLLILDGFTLRNSQIDDNIRFQVRSSTSQVTNLDVITVKAQSQHVGILEPDPQYTLDVGGDARIAGDLTVEGDTFSVEVSTLQVEDKNIDLASTTTPSDSIADGGGIVLKGNTDKTILWTNANNHWTSSEHFNIASGKDYRVNGTAVLSETRLYDTVTRATGLTQVGTLQNLTVDTVYIDNDTLGRTGANTGLTIQANAGDINVSNSKITSLDTPTNPSDAATKDYVDQSVRVDPLVFALDVTGWVQPDIRNSRIEAYLEQVFPAFPAINGKTANVITFYYADQVVEDINVNDNSVKEFESVQAAGGGTVTVLEDIGLPTSLSGTYTPTVTRETRVFEIVGGVWTFQSALPTP